MRILGGAWFKGLFYIFISLEKIENVDMLLSVVGLFFKNISRENVFFLSFKQIYLLLFSVFFKNEKKILKLSITLVSRAWYLF